MDKAGDNLKNILEINEKLNLVRDDINRKTGQLKRLADLTDLTTVNVTLREKQKYDGEKAPVAAETPTFGMRASRISFGLVPHVRVNNNRDASRARRRVQSEYTHALD